MEKLTYHMRCLVLDLARKDKHQARHKMESFVETAHHMLKGDELEEFLRDVEVLGHDVEQM